MFWSPCGATPGKFVDNNKMAEKQEEFKNMATEPKINDLPIEMFVEVFKHLNIDEIAFKHTEVCIQWRENIALHILAPELVRISAMDKRFKSLLEKNNWTEDCKDIDLILSFYDKYDYYTSKTMFFKD